MDRPIPTTFAEIRVDWLTDALRSGGIIDEVTRVTTCAYRILGTGEGFAGELARLNVTYEGGAGPATMVAKIPTSIDDNRNGSELLGVYEREIQMYRALLPSLDVPVPRLYYADFEPNADWERQLDALRRAERLPIWILRIVVWFLQRFAKPDLRPSVLILEDLAPAEVGDQVAPSSLERVGDVLEVAARMHASTWGGRLPDPCSWLLSGGFAPRLLQASFLGMRGRFLRGEGRNASDHMKKLLGRLRRDGLDLSRRLHETLPQCLVHGDLRLDNIFFDGDTVRALIDWQLTRIGPAVVDVAYCIAGSVEPDVSEDEVEALLVRYHTALVAAGVDDYSFDDFRADYGDGLLSVLGGVTAVEQIDLGDERGRDLAECMVRRLDARLRRIAA